MFRNLNRREILALAAASALPARSLAHDGYIGQYLIAEKARASLLADYSIGTDVYRFRAHDKLPIIRAKQGVELRFRLFNELDEDVAFQFYGVRGKEHELTFQLPARSATETSPSVEVVLTPPDAGTFWFGPLLNASRQRDMGLSAMFIVDEAKAEPAIPDIPLIIDDWMIGDDGKLDADFQNLERLISTGRVGNWFTANQRFKPSIPVPKSSPFRLRILNVSNAQTMNLSLRGGDGLLLALDGQPLARTRVLLRDSLALAPGQRADVFVPKLAEQATLDLDLGQDVIEVAFLDPLQQAAAIDLPKNSALPPNPLPAAGDNARAISLSLEGGEKGGLKTAMVGFEQLDLRQMLERGFAWAINGVAGLGGPVLFTAKQGETLSLEFDNRTNFEQVICVHGHVWYMYEQAGKPVERQYNSDTAVIPALSQAKLFMVAHSEGAWLIQSAQAERSDGGMIGTFKIEA